MRLALKVLGGLFLAAGVISGIAIVAGAAMGKEGFTTLTELIPGMAFHVGSMFAGMSCFGLVAKKRDPAKA